jgi:acyl transferase domain-containing protein
MSEIDHGAAEPLQGIAVIGIGARFPGARNAAELWRNLRDGVESISFFTTEELAAAGIDPGLLADPRYVPAKGALEDADRFDAAFFGFTPREAEVMDPQHRVFLECAWEALEDAGHDPGSPAGRIGVYAGSGASSYLLNNLLPNAARLESLGDLQAVLLNDRDFLATRTAYELDLRGPSVSVQTACSTSLVAVHMASQSLLAGECDLALAGGVSISSPLRTGYLYEEGSVMSPDGHCRAFDAGAAGSVEGNGCGVVVLRRLADALEDGDHVYAVIRGSAVNNDGAGKVGFTAPSVEGQAEVIAESLLMAGVEPATIGLVEAHGSGTPLGDPIEMAALAQAFAGVPAGSCAIGSLKTNLGHCNAAAGVAGLIKAALSLAHRTLPPSLHFEAPNPQIDLAAGPFRVLGKAAPWPAGETPRRAGVSSFGLGGTNAHAVLEEAPDPEPGDPPTRPAQLLVLSARTPAALDAAAERLAAHLESSPDIANIADIAWTSQVGRRGFEHRRAVVAHDRKDAIAALRDPARALSGRREGAKGRPVVFLFPGLGDQYPGMARGLYATEPVFRETVDRCAEKLAAWLGGDLRQALFADSGESAAGGGPDLRALLRRDGREESAAAARLRRTDVAQPACFVVEYALARLLMDWGIEPQAMIGYSVGEYVAACVAGALSLDEALELVAQRARLIQELPEGAMLAVPLPEAEVRPLLEEAGTGALAVAATNGPHFCVVAGPEKAVGVLERLLAGRGASCLRLRTTHAFHAPAMQPAAAAFAEIVRPVRMRTPRIPWLSNVTGTWMTAEDLADPGYWVRHMVGTVRFAEGLGELLQEPRRALLEIGPGSSLTTLARQHPEAPRDLITAAALRREGEGSSAAESDVEHLLAAVGRLWAAGVAVDWRRFHGGARRLRVPLPTYPFERQRYWIDPPVAPSAPTPPAPRPAASSAEDIADWFWTPVWNQAPLPPRFAMPEDGAERWLVFADQGGLGTRIAERLRKEGRAVATVTPRSGFADSGGGSYTIDPARRQDYDTLLARLREAGGVPARVLHVWGVTAGEPAVEEALAAGLLSLVLLAQAVEGAGGPARVHAAVVANGLHEVLDGDPVHPVKAAVLGAVKVIGQESARLACVSVDIAPPPPGSRAEEALIDGLLAELSVAPVEQVVAWRGRRRWVRGFEPLRLPAAAAGASRLVPGAAWLIAGAAHGPGMAIAEALVRSLDARVALVLPPQMPPRERWETWEGLPGVPPGQDVIGAAIGRLLALERSTGLDRVLILRAEPGDPFNLRDALARAAEAFGPIRGVFYAEGAHTGGLVQLRTPESLRAGLAPVARGAQALLAAAAAGEAPRPELIVLCSSTQAVTGGLGQLDLAAAGALLEGFAAQAAARAAAESSAAGEERPLVIAVHWDPYQWDGWLVAGAAGAVAGLEPQEVRRNIELHGIPAARSAEALRRLLAAVAPGVVVSARDLPGLIAETDAATTDVLLAQMASVRAERAGRDGLSRPYAPPRDALEESLAALWQELFGIAPIGIEDGFLELGGHSLLAIQMATQLRARFAVDLPVTALFEAPTIAELARTVRRARGEEDPQDLESLLAQVEGLSPEEALRRMEEMTSGLAAAGRVAR